MNKEETLALWRQGKDAWNAWAKQMLDRRAAMERDGTWAVRRGLFGAEQEPDNPDNEATAVWMKEAAANFDGQVFDAKEDFSNVLFPASASFVQVTFMRDVWFCRATFSGGVSFSGATFSRDAQFSSTTFSGDAQFGSATFTQAWFYSATFSENAYFANATFNGLSLFTKARFCKSVEFSGGGEFSKDAHFKEVAFSGMVRFYSKPFKENAWFNNAIFSGSTEFTCAKFKGDAGFGQANFKGYTNFAQATFRGLADFSAAQGERGFTLEGASFAEVPDFIQAHFSEAPRLDNVRVNPGGPDDDRSARYRALKRLAIDGHDHVREQEYFAGELKSLRGCPDRLLPNPRNWFRRDDDGNRLPAWPGGARYWFGLIYQLLSDFGRSMLRPLGWWLLALAGFAVGYLAQHFARAAEIGLGYSNSVVTWLWGSIGQWLTDRFLGLTDLLPASGAVDATACLAGPGTPWSAALGLSIRKALPFAGIASSEKLNQIYACLYGIHGQTGRVDQLPDRFTPVIPDAVDYLGMVQLVLSLLLLFLFLLAVRSHFRIR